MATPWGESEKPNVSNYMTRDVETVEPDVSVETVSTRIAESAGHNGFPVCKNEHVVGFVSARDLLAADPDAPIKEIMSDDLLVAHPEMDVNDAARVILRSGIQKLPVADDDGRLVGIISNADMIRSQIERATPGKVGRLKRTLEKIHDIEAEEDRRTVQLADLVPTQTEVYADELEGRRYELERGLAEPLVVIDCADATQTGGQAAETATQADGAGMHIDSADEQPPRQLLLADGHHRALAANRLEIDAVEAYVIVMPDGVELGLAESAQKECLETIDDIDIVDYARHPLVETTERLQ